jgi:penicillin-binding protein 2
MNNSYGSSDNLKRFYRGRITVLMALVVAVFLVYLGYLFHLQIVKGLEYKNRAKQVAQRVIPIQAQRGEIYDRHFDDPLAVNVDSFAVDIIPAELDDAALKRVAERLAGRLNMTAEEIIREIPSSHRNLYQPVEIKNGVDYDTITYIAEHIGRFPGVTWHSKPIRRYQDVGSLAHVLGYVGHITSEELQVLYNEGYTINSMIGKSGIEKQYDQMLRGENGKRYRTVDVHGKQVSTSTLKEVPPENGKNLVLTVDERIQKLSEKALGERMGSAVVMKPATGEILAMVSYPWFDANRFYDDNAERAFRSYSLDPNNPFLNRAIQSSYAPASTFKVVMTTAAVEEEAIPIEKEIMCTGSLRVGNRVFDCWRPEGHGKVDLPQGLAQSCDVYYYTLGLNYLGIDMISKYARRFGYGELTGVDLPGEVRGLVPTPEWKERVHHTPWVGGDTVNTSIGQGYLDVTPLQMANMVAMTVNEGKVYKPHLLKEVRDPVSGALLETNEPELLRSSSIRPETFRKVQEYMRGVVTDGTAEVVITTDAVKVAGKTGTGEVGYEDRWHAWFAANGPYGAPPEDQVVVVVMVEASNEWEWWAVRAANIIFQGMFADQSYEEALEALNWEWLHNDRQ